MSTFADNDDPTQSLSSVVEREGLIKEIQDLQDGLRALLSRVDGVTDECNKLKASNDTLQTYIDNLTRNSVLIAGHK
ncbi:uncharacterized protein L969DRAFT_19691 [Mixia osmundae IAM 14324]|uniref:Uncharacterized protein n=1 Tax=Mixia osmundae (strain CBS 9802 / IAM 14324 / JCM 22182 / KY 12970) TaxID=764103 RepID=G7DZH7_MIXOS|nr:uncharacterized protein L969DRAFT_19691 [Mixia osmundae IAM 14324]KEI37156.1 hypothetical protein L969DRAFT_19691 [Mixia osmundae IAM 14324]GAA95987.1 hypothetical protein E5Q_02645 [Mixia osmundae IAM 14324]